MMMRVKRISTGMLTASQKIANIIEKIKIGRLRPKPIIDEPAGSQNFQVTDYAKLPFVQVKFACV
jgi:hypothetical protein